MATPLEEGRAAAPKWGKRKERTKSKLKANYIGYKPLFITTDPERDGPGYIGYILGYKLSAKIFNDFNILSRVYNFITDITGVCNRRVGYIGYIRPAGGYIGYIQGGQGGHGVPLTLYFPRPARSMRLSPTIR